ncbi:integrin beta-7-like isoform X2 [Xyrauchen texanus]|uniref:integrin beta-7-like isoform X2 n=1 Tax=Xyrauchen texanus TaxID=154827 RepID=UPI002241D05D|nr:integrin beta-7-like isoform X2 [Xyrauchen texanus]
MVMKSIVIVTFLLHCVGQRPILGQEPLCQSLPSCSECITSPGCAWCTQTGFLKSGESNERRCDTPESLQTRSCKEEYVINPVKHPKTYMKNNDLSSDAENVVQLKPQNVKIKLRVGVPYEFNIEFKRAQGYPIDLYYLMDLSYSMKDDLEQIKTLGQKILRKLKEITQTVRIGFGSFVDKQMLPYVSQVKEKRQNPCPNRIDTCQPAFSFQNVLPLTDNAKEFKKEVSKQKISGNLDSPEAGLDAIMQAAVCKDKIKWGDVTRILVYTSDDTFHMAGDGRLAGVYQPHNGECHLNDKGSYDGKSYDYPSVGHLSRVLQDNNIQLIFAVTEGIYPAYKALSALIPQSVVGVLKNDSSNVVDLISEAYGNLSSTLVLEQEGAPEELHVSYRSNCKGNQAGTEWKEKGECKDIKHEKVQFQVRLNMTKCLKKPQTFRIKMQGISEEVKVNVETVCDCDCDPPEESSQHCNGTGTLLCGVCRCKGNSLGQHCECEKQEDMDSTLTMLASCRPDNNSQVCNGNGICECGKCVCHGQYSGQYCLCDDSSCERHNNKLCNGKGSCKCGKCLCEENYTGTACDCSPSTDKCVGELGLCSSQGECICNQCKCKDGFRGDHCSAFINVCTQFKDCVACLVDESHTVCAKRCSATEILHLKGTHELQCTYKDTNSYDVKLGSKGEVLLQIAELPRSIDKTTLIIGSSVSSIIVIGIVIIIIYRVLLELYDIREYQNFVKAEKQTEWKEVQNPLFQGATTTVLNPLHVQDDE